MSFDFILVSLLLFLLVVNFVSKFLSTLQIGQSFSVSWREWIFVPRVKIFFLDYRTNDNNDDSFSFHRVKLSEAHMHPDVYRYLDDSIIQIITISNDERLKEAQEYLGRVRTRNLYPIVGISSQGFEVTIETTIFFLLSNFIERVKSFDHFLFISRVSRMSTIFKEFFFDFFRSSWW